MAQQIGAEIMVAVVDDVRGCTFGHIVVSCYFDGKLTSDTEAALLNKRSRLAPTLGVTKVIIVKDIISVTMLCPT